MSARSSVVSVHSRVNRRSVQDSRHSIVSRHSLDPPGENAPMTKLESIRSVKSIKSQTFISNSESPTLQVPGHHTEEVTVQNSNDAAWQDHLRTLVREELRSSIR